MEKVKFAFTTNCASIQRVVYCVIHQVFFVYSFTLLSYDKKVFTIYNDGQRYQLTEQLSPISKHWIQITYGVGDPSIDLTRAQTCNVVKLVNEFTSLPL